LQSLQVLLVQVLLPSPQALEHTWLDSDTLHVCQTLSLHVCVPGPQLSLQSRVVSGTLQALQTLLAHVMLPLPQLLAQARDLVVTTQDCQNPELHVCSPAPQTFWQVRVAPDSKQGSSSGNEERAPHESAAVIVSPVRPPRTQARRRLKFATHKPTSTFVQFNLDFAKRFAADK
jgi:hypothetical protein